LTNPAFFATPDTMRRTTLFTTLFLSVTFVAAATPALAAFNVCNRAAQPARIAIGRFDGASWTSEGWWTVRPKSCSAILTGPLQGRFYYLYASDGPAGTWEGKTRFCVSPGQRFKATGRGNCAKRGYDTRGFFEIDTGKKSDWTQSLSN
jgi:uncharacterized membrane protein